MMSQQAPPGNAEGRLRNREKAVHTWSSATVAASFARLVCGPRSSPSLASLGLLRWWLGLLRWWLASHTIARYRTSRSAIACGINLVYSYVY